MIRLTTSLEGFAAKDGIRVNCLAPGWIATVPASPVLGIADTCATDRARGPLAAFERRRRIECCDPSGNRSHARRMGSAVVVGRPSSPDPVRRSRIQRRDEIVLQSLRKVFSTRPRNLSRI